MKTWRMLVLLALMMVSVGTAHADSLVLTFVGDTSIGDAFQYKGYAESYHSVVMREGVSWPLSLVAETLQKDDLTIANLEGSITLSTKHKDIRYPLVIDPSMLDVLTKGGIDVVNTANNHAMDFFAAGYSDTLRFLDEAGIHHFGTLSPPSRTNINRQTMVEVKGVRIGFIGFTYPQDADIPLIDAAAGALRDQGCDLIILSLHWGRETHMTPSAAQFSFAKSALALDVDVIFGHHPHVLQSVALYAGKPVMFSTGNFTFGTMSSVDPSSGMFQLEYTLEGDQPILSTLRVIPCITGPSGDYRPTPALDDAQKASVLSKLRLKKPPKGFEPLPEVFYTTGEVVFEQSIP